MVFCRASLKLGLDKAVLQSMQQPSSTSNGVKVCVTVSHGLRSYHVICAVVQAPQLSKKEIEDLLKKGAYGAIMDEDDDANR